MSAQSTRSGGLAMLAAIAGLACTGHTPIADCRPHAGATPICAFQNPEDLAVTPLASDWLIVSQFPRSDAPGSIAGFRPQDGRRELLWGGDAESPARPGPASDCAEAPATSDFGPHGIDVSHDGRELLVVNHGGREAVERFAVSVGEDGIPALVWTGCVAMPEDASMNDVAALPGGGFVVTQMGVSGLGALRVLLKLESGRVYHYDGSELAAIPNSEGKAPNGVAASADGRTVYFAEWNGHRLVEIGLDGTGRRTIELGFSPDNLTWDAQGRMLVGGQDASPLEAMQCFDLEEGGCSIASRVARVDLATRDVEILFREDDPAIVIGGVSVALAHDGRIWIGAYSGDRIAWIPEP